MGSTIFVNSFYFTGENCMNVDAPALWMKMKEGSQEAFMEMYNHYYQSLYVFGCRVNANQQLVKDSIHEVFCEVWAGREKLPPVQQPLPYLFTYLKRKMLREIRISALPMEEGLQHGQVEQSYEDLLILAEKDEEMRLKIRHFASQLSATQQAILQLKYYENLPYEQIAERLQLQPRTIYNKLHEALKIMRQSLRMLAFPLFFLFF